MAKAKFTRLEIDNEKKTIICDIARLTPEQEEQLQKYIRFGYTVLAREKAKVEKSANAPRLDYDYISTYLKNNAPSDRVAEFEKMAEEKGFMKASVWFRTHYPENVAEAEKAIKEAGLFEEYQKQAVAYQKKKPTKAEKEAGKEKLSADGYLRNWYWRNVFGK